MLLYLLGFIRGLLQSMSVVVSMNVVIAVAYDFGVVRAIVATVGRFLSGCVGTTAIEWTAATSLPGVGN